MAGSTDDFSYLSNDVGNLSIALANGETLQGIGRVSLPSGSLSKGFHVPGLDKTLLLAISENLTMYIFQTFLLCLSGRYENWLVNETY